MCVYVWRGKEGGYLCGSEEADGVEVFHGLSASVVEQLKQIHFLLQYL